MIGFPFDSHVTFDSDSNPVYDRAVNSAAYRKLIGSLFKTGVMPNPSSNLQVTQGEDLTIIVRAGFCVVEGCMKLEEKDRELICQTGGSNDRIDTVVMRLNDNDDVRSCDLYIVQGTPSKTPVHPDLTRTSSIYEIGLADIYVPAGSTTVAQYRITDTRLDDTRCGVISSVSEFDTTAIHDQITSDLAGFRTEFNTWFAELQDVLDESTAGHLQNEINKIISRLDNLSTDASKITFDNSGTDLNADNVQDAIEETNEANAINTNDIAKLGGILGNIKAVYAGTKVSSSSTARSSRDLFTSAQAGELVGVSALTSANGCIFVGNGDGGSNSVHVESATYIGADKKWYAVLDSSVTGSVRLNYLIVRFGD